MLSLSSNAATSESMARGSVHFGALRIAGEVRAGSTFAVLRLITDNSSSRSSHLQECSLGSRIAYLARGAALQGALLCEPYLTKQCRSHLVFNGDWATIKGMYISHGSDPYLSSRKHTLSIRSKSTIYGVSSIAALLPHTKRGPQQRDDDACCSHSQISPVFCEVIYPRLLTLVSHSFML